ncbi:MAG: ABC transporter permease, partial [bacterium]|nr:ABC transporter permease [bacterium]
AGFLTLVGVVTGLTVLYGLLLASRPVVESHFGLFIAIGGLSMYELSLIGIVSLAGFLIGGIPSYRAYRYSVADGMMIRV